MAKIEDKLLNYSYHFGISLEEEKYKKIPMIGQPGSLCEVTNSKKAAVTGRPIMEHSEPRE